MFYHVLPHQADVIMRDFVRDHRGMFSVNGYRLRGRNCTGAKISVLKHAEILGLVVRPYGLGHLLRCQDSPQLVLVCLSLLLNKLSLDTWPTQAVRPCEYGSIHKKATQKQLVSYQK